MGIGSRRWPQECQPCVLVEANSGIPKVSYVVFRSATVVTLDGGLPVEGFVLKQDDAGCNREVGIPEDDV